jgi:DNA-directed RNA polymerase III subunit RPC2
MCPRESTYVFILNPSRIQVPMCRSKILDMANFDMLPAGQNAIIAVMSFSGYDIEDAVVLNRASLDRGYGRVISHSKFSTSIRQHVNQSMDRISIPPVYDPEKHKHDTPQERAVYEKQHEKYR